MVMVIVVVVATSNAMQLTSLILLALLKLNYDTDMYIRNLQIKEHEL